MCASNPVASDTLVVPQHPVTWHTISLLCWEWSTTLWSRGVLFPWMDGVEKMLYLFNWLNWLIFYLSICSTEDSRNWPTFKQVVGPLSACSRDVSQIWLDLEVVALAGLPDPAVLHSNLCRVRHAASQPTSKEQKISLPFSLILIHVHIPKKSVQKSSLHQYCPHHLLIPCPGINYISAKLDTSAKSKWAK